MTAPSTETTTRETSGSSKLSITTILIPVLLSTLLTLGAVGGTAYWLVRSGRLARFSAPAATSPSIILVAPPASHVLALEPMIVNLSDAAGRSYLRAAVSLRIKDETPADDKKEKSDARGTDAVATSLRDITLAVLSRESADSLLVPDGREALKERLLQEFRLHSTGVVVLEVYFTDFLVQRG